MMEAFEENPPFLRYSPERGTSKPEAVTAAVQKIWNDKLQTEAGRQEIAEALGVAPKDVREGPPPVFVEEGVSGVTGVEVAVAVHWAAVNIVVPVLISVAKDEVKDRVKRLWKWVFRPELEAAESGVRLGEERNGH